MAREITTSFAPEVDRLLAEVCARHGVTFSEAWATNARGARSTDPILAQARRECVRAAVDYRAPNGSGYAIRRVARIFRISPFAVREALQRVPPLPPATGAKTFLPTDEGFRRALEETAAQLDQASAILASAAERLRRLAERPSTATTE